MKRKRLDRGFTLVELMIVVAIISVLASIVQPQFDLLFQKATQSATKGNLGSLRSALSIYYVDMEGIWPMFGVPDGYADANDLSLSQMVSPRYIKAVPTPHLAERLGSFNGLSLDYDEQASAWMSYDPPKDVVIIRGTPGPTPFINRPYVYDPSNGVVYICNGNYDHSGVDRFYSW